MDDASLQGHTESFPDETELENDQEREQVQQEGWSALGWSFAGSASMTVRHALATCDLLRTLSLCHELAAYFFPVVFSIPLFGTYLAKEWLWNFNPSLSYVGQGGIRPVERPQGLLNFLTDRNHYGLPDNSEHEPCM